MITAFILKNGRLEQTRVTKKEDLLPQPIWIDLIDPDEDERALIEDYYQFDLPQPTEIKDIEASARYFEDDDGMHIHSFFLNSYEDKATNVTVAFSIYNGLLFTLHEADLSAFRLYRMRARKFTMNELDGVKDALDILIGLHETSVEHVADILEQIYANLETVSLKVLKRNHSNEDIHNEDEQNNLIESTTTKIVDDKSRQTEMENILSEIAIQEDFNGKARLSLMDTRRSLSFLLRSKLLTGNQLKDAKEIIMDIESLTNHTSFLFDKINFLLDALMGIISLEQNRIIKIFSIASVVFLPPTVVASVYGMNFKYIPELDWIHGYPFALILLIVSGMTPYLFFKKKGWL